MQKKIVFLHCLPRGSEVSDEVFRKTILCVAASFK